MSITAIIMAIIGVIGAIAGGFLGHGIGKSQGKSEGIQQQSDNQKVEQAKVIVQAVQERANVEVKVANSTDADLDSELSKYDRSS